MVSDSQLLAPSSSDALLSKLEEPRVAEALRNLLDHADLLAVLLTGLDGLVRRGDTITDNLAKAVGEVRGAVAASPDTLNVDLPKLAANLRTLSGAISDATPGLTLLLRSDLTDPRLMDTVSLIARAMIGGAAQAELEPTKVTGVLGLLRALKDEDVARGLGFLIQLAKALGRELNHT